MSQTGVRVGVWISICSRLAVERERKMVHDDLRVEWIRQRVSAGFNLYECPECFDELLSRGDGEEERNIIRYLNLLSEEDSPSCLLFFKTIREEEVEVQVPAGELAPVLLAFTGAGPCRGCWRVRCAKSSRGHTEQDFQTLPQHNLIQIISM